MMLYIHVPFCRSRCRYCAFYSNALDGSAIPENFVRTLLQEMDYWASLFDPHQKILTSVFFGGGTPSLLRPQDISLLLEQATAKFSLSDKAEITLEGNPDSLVLPGRARALCLAGINRISMGVQSMNNTELAALGRIHNRNDVCRAVDALHKTGLGNISLDLMWGLPNQTAAGWLETIAATAALAPKHISAYALSLEPGTALWRQDQQTPLPLPDEAEARRMYLDGSALLEQLGFEQYEISNFACSGFTCRHNLGYWLGKDYLGIGPSAVSTCNLRRWTDSPDLALWQQDVLTGHLASQPEALTPVTRLQEALMLRLRTRAGLPLSTYFSLTGRDFVTDHRDFLQAAVHAGLMNRHNDNILLTREGMLVSNAILADLFERCEQLGTAGTQAPGRKA